MLRHPASPESLQSVFQHTDSLQAGREWRPLTAQSRRAKTLRGPNAGRTHRVFRGVDSVRGTFDPPTKTAVLVHVTLAEQLKKGWACRNLLRKVLAGPASVGICCARSPLPHQQPKRSTRILENSGPIVSHATFAAARAVGSGQAFVMAPARSTHQLVPLSRPQTRGQRQLRWTSTHAWSPPPSSAAAATRASPGAAPTATMPPQRPPEASSGAGGDAGARGTAHSAAGVATTWTGVSLAAAAAAAVGLAMWPGSLAHLTSSIQPACTVGGEMCKVAGGAGGWNVLAKLGDAALVRREAALAAASFAVAAALGPLLRWAHSRRGVEAALGLPHPGGSAAAVAAAGEGFETSFWAAVEGPLRLAVVASALSHAACHTGLTHDLFYLAAGKWGCAVSALHLDELSMAAALSWALLRLKRTLLVGFFRSAANRGTIDMRVLRTLDVVLSIVCCVAGLAYCSDALALPLSRFAASLGAFGLLLGLASQELAMNLVGGLVLLTTRPFDLGDSVSAPLPYGVGMLRGTVVDISLLRTTLVGSEGTPVSVPNRTWTTAICFNHSRAHLAETAATAGASRPPPSSVPASSSAEPSLPQASSTSTLAEPNGMPTTFSSPPTSSTPSSSFTPTSSSTFLGTVSAPSTSSGDATSPTLGGAVPAGDAPIWLHLHFHLPLGRAAQAPQLTSKVAALLESLPTAVLGQRALVTASDIALDPMGREVVHFNAQSLIRLDARGGASCYAEARGAAVLGISALLLEMEHAST